MRKTFKSQIRKPRASALEQIPKLLKTYWWFGWCLCFFSLFSLLPEHKSFPRRFHGRKWRKPGVTNHVKPIYETPWAYVETHEVKIDGKIIADWLWMDEKPAVNVLARKDGKFILFEQTKYGFLTNSLAPVGGMIEKRETADIAAKRELLEELSLESDEWTELGTYRTMANHGGGFSTFYLADNCYDAKKKSKKKSDDLEKQTIILVDEDELRDRLLKGEFQEVKWTADVALALLHLEEGRKISNKNMIKNEEGGEKKVNDVIIDDIVEKEPENDKKDTEKLENKENVSDDKGIEEKQSIV